VARSQAEKEPPGETGFKRTCVGCELLGCIGPDAYDPARNRHRCRGRKKLPETARDSRVESTGRPERSVAQGLELGCDVGRTSACIPRTAPPDPDPAELHRSEISDLVPAEADRISRTAPGEPSGRVARPPSPGAARGRVSRRETTRSPWADYLPGSSRPVPDGP
jgi:hypothetical protein